MLLQLNCSLFTWFARVSIYKIFQPRGRGEEKRNGEKNEIERERKEWEKERREWPWQIDLLCKWKDFSTISGESVNCKWEKIWTDNKTQKCNTYQLRQKPQMYFELLFRENKDSVFKQLSTTLKHGPISAVFCFLIKLNLSGFGTCC